LKDLLFNTISLLTILNPVAAAAIMLSLVKYSEIKPVARKTTIAVFVASIITMFAGGYLLKVFGINIPSIKAIGGVVLLIIGLNMIQGKSIAHTNSTEEEHNAAQEKEDVAIIPLAIPILFGPGFITTIIVLAEKAITIELKITLLISILLSSIVTYIVLVNANTISRFLGVNGLKVLTRIMGLIIGAIAFIFLVNGVKELWLM
jgi:multiple antibiotic resistance protein